jgi:omega-6 fatty acid desaturase (delta-12 desaturase)
VELPAWVEILLHNITVHGAHHVDPRVPFRHLPDAQRRLERAFTDDVIVERWSLASFFAVTKACKLYDYDAHQWRTFRMAMEPRRHEEHEGVIVYSGPQPFT